MFGFCVFLTILFRWEEGGEAVCGFHKLAGRAGSYANFVEKCFKRHSVGEDPHHDLGFLHCSSAEVERLWSKALHIFGNTRRRMTVTMFECLLYLKENRRHWNDGTVLLALQQCRDEKRSSAVVLDDEDERFQEVLDQF